MNQEKIVKQQTIEKGKVIDEIKEKLKSSSAFYVTRYDGIDVENISKLRKDLKDNDSEMKVFKNTMVIRALEDSEYKDDFTEILKGPNSLTFAYSDPVAPAKVLFDFAKKNKELKIKGCLFENEYYGADKMSVIKDLPTKETLYAMIANVLNEPMSRVARIIDALRESKGSESEETDK
ncbi:MAG: 50S ribosomal protein L10 [Candidatus Delongbacteria bacterium]